MIDSFFKRLVRTAVVCGIVFFCFAAVSCSFLEPVEKGSVSFTVTKPMTQSIKPHKSLVNLSGPLFDGDPGNTGDINGSSTDVNYTFITVTLSGGYKAEKTVPFDEGQEIVFSGVPVNTDVQIKAIVFERFLKDGEEVVVNHFISKKNVKIKSGRNDIGLVLREWTDGYFVRTLYVSSDGHDESYDAETSDGQITVIPTGSESKPFATIDRACQKIIDEGDDETDWTIYVCGEITGSLKGSGSDNVYGQTTIPSDLKKEHAHSILITGFRGVDEKTGLPLDSLNRNQAGNVNNVTNGTVLVINTAVPVTITNLKITGGFGSGVKAGGINISQGAVLSLGDGALITGNRNSSNGRGGAIHNEGTLFMYGSAVIGDKTNGGKTSEDNFTYAADSSTCTDFTKLANYGSSGGGIYNGSASDKSVKAKLYLGYKLGEDGNPEVNELTGGLYYNGGTGGALYNAAGSYVYFDSGYFSWNGTEGGGGAVHNSGTFEMTGGNIEHNRALGLNAAYGGAVYNENSSSVFIMSGGTINHNIAYRFYSYGDLSYGGALYNNGKFFMYGTAVIGDKNAAQPASKDITTPDENGKIPDDTTTHVSAWGNKAWRGGAIYNNVNTASGQNGGLYIGFKPDSNGNPVPEELTDGGGIYYNYSAYTTTSSSSTNCYGGGAIESTGTIKIASGTIAYNKTESYGGAIRYSRGNNCVFEISGGTIRDNEASIGGGAIYIASDNSNNLTLSGSVLIPAGDNNRHDIYLTTSTKTYYPKITVAEKLNSDFAVHLTPVLYDPSMSLLLNGGIDESDFATECAKFTVADEVNDALGTTTQWYINESGKLTAREPLGTLTMTIEHGTYSDISISARYYDSASSYNSGANGTAFYSGSSIALGKYLVFTASLPAGKTVSSAGYTWYFDSVEQEFADGADTSKFAVDSSEWSAGVYDITVEAADTKGNHYSAEYHITVK